MVGVEEDQPSGRSQYNIEEEESKREYFDSAEALEKKVSKVADWVKASKHIIVFTGAGVSTRLEYSFFIVVLKLCVNIFQASRACACIYVLLRTVNVTAPPPHTHTHTHTTVLVFQISVVVWTRC